MAESTNQCPQCGVTVVTSKRGPEFRCPCCDATTIDLDSETTRTGQRGDLVRRRNLDLSRFIIEMRGTDLFVRWNWSRGKGVPGLAILAILIVFFGHSAAVLVKKDLAGIANFDESALAAPDLLEAVFALGPLVMGAGLLHASLCCFLNRTEIAFGSNELRVWHGPFASGTARRHGDSRARWRLAN